MTAFPTEYRSSQEDQDSRFVINVECLNKDEVDDHIQELLDEYRKPYLCNLTELTEAEYDTATTKSSAAQQIFKTAFGMSEFSSKDLSEPYPDLDLETMKEESQGAYDAILSELRRRGRAFEWPVEMKNGNWEAKADTVEEVSELMEPFMVLGLWVFVKLAR